MEPRIIFENEEFVVAMKPAGLLVHRVRVSSARRSRRVDEERLAEPTLADWIVGRYPEVAQVGDDPEYRPGIVHRLDKETSGVMVVARTQASFEWLKAAFASREMKKEYAALVYGIPEPAKGTIDRPIGIKTGTLKRSVHVSKMAKEAVTDYEVKKAWSQNFSLVAVRPHTGRTHQIRVHLAAIGHPIVGDILYAAKRMRREKGDAGRPRLMLHAQSLSFSDPAGRRFEFEAPPPPDFLEVIHRIAEGNNAI